MSGISTPDLSPLDRYKLVDMAKMYVDLAAYRPIGGMFGNLYAYQRDTFAMDRES